MRPNNIPLEPLFGITLEKLITEKKQIMNEMSTFP